jgi:hypothetical protein
MHLDLDRVRANAEKASTEDLLERVTVFRAQMEPEAVELIEQVLWRRGVGPERVAEFGRQATEKILRRADGTPATCSFCSRAAVAAGWGWHRWRGGLPLFPRRFRYCPEHRPRSPTAPGEPR